MRIEYYPENIMVFVSLSVSTVGAENSPFFYFYFTKQLSRFQFSELPISRTKLYFPWICAVIPLLDISNPLIIRNSRKLEI